MKDCKELVEATEIIIHNPKETNEHIVDDVEYVTEKLGWIKDCYATVGELNGMISAIVKRNAARALERAMRFEEEKSSSDSDDDSDSDSDNDSDSDSDSDDASG